MTRYSLASLDKMAQLPHGFAPLEHLILDGGATATAGLCLQGLNGYHFLSSNSYTGEASTLFKKGGQFQPYLMFPGSNVPNPGAYAVVHSDALMLNYSSTSVLAVNLRQDGAARNLNNNAALPGLPFMTATLAGTGYGSAAFQALPVASYPSYAANINHYEDARYLIPAPTVDTTYPTVAAPSTPTVAAATTGGKLPDDDYFGTLVWVTKTNDLWAGQGFTVASAEWNATVSGGGGNGSIQVTVPALPTNAIGYAVTIGTVAGTTYVCGGGRTAGTHTIKALMTGTGSLLMTDRFFYMGSSGLQPLLRSAAIENANPITAGPQRNVTSGFTAALWSPYFIDPTQIYMLPYNTSNYTQKADKFDILAGTISLNQTLGWNGEPNVTYSNAAGSSISYRSIPELAAYAIIHRGNNSLGATGGYPSTVQVRSCLTNQVLWSWASYDGEPYNESANSCSVGPCDFETIDGNTYMLWASRKLRGIVMQPIRILPD